MVPSQSSLRFLCFGAGAIGTYIGGSLAKSGQKVVFLDRPGMVEQLQRDGLYLDILGAESHLESIEAAASLDAVLAKGPFDFGILAVKAFDTQAFADQLRPYAAQLPPVISFQNGVENEPLLAAALGQEKVVYGSVTSAVGRRAVGNIVLEKHRGVGVAGELPMMPTLVDAMNAAELNTKLYHNASAMKWSKMLTNLQTNASSAILNMLPSQVLADPRLYRLEMLQLREALAVMDALHLPVVNLPGTPVRLLAWMVESLPFAISQPLAQVFLGRGRGAKKPSFLIDLEAGRDKSEVDYLNGAVVRFGERLGVPTPVNRALNQTLDAIVRGEKDWAEFSGKPEALLAAAGLLAVAGL
jgi:2-dehydropantoate 2-reductase